MIVVVVAEQDGIDAPQIGERQRHGVVTLWPGERNWAGAKPPHRVCQQTQAVDLDKHGRVAQPREPQPVRRRSIQAYLGRSIERNRARRRPLFAAKDKVGGHA